jgi:hypothetical protein
MLWGQDFGRAGLIAVGVMAHISSAPAQSIFSTPAAPSASLVAPGPAAPSTSSPLQAPVQITPLPAAPITAPSPAAAAPGQAVLQLAARFGRDLPQITSGLQWRIFADKPEANGTFRMVREDKSAAPSLLLPSGNYIVHLSFGLANAAKRVQLRSDTVREYFDLPAGGLRLEGRVGDVRIPATQISFDLYKGSQFEAGDKRALKQAIVTGDIVLVPEGVYTIVSNYGDGNAVVRSDIRVQAGKLTDVTVTHRAAVITLKLVAREGGEALANTAWSVLTPGGDVIKESIGAFPRVILAEGEYKVIARNDGRVFERDFKVITGVDSEVSVVAR